MLKNESSDAVRKRNVRRRTRRAKRRARAGSVLRRVRRRGLSLVPLLVSGALLRGLRAGPPPGGAPAVPVAGPPPRDLAGAPPRDMGAPPHVSRVGGAAQDCRVPITADRPISVT